MNAYSEKYHAALVLAARAHRNQTRKGSDIPYLVHPVQVSIILLRHAFQEDMVLAGLLHDVVEDTETPLHRIEAEFGPAVAGMVAVLTEQKREDGVERPWEVRKREALEALRRGGADAVAVKGADAIHNARSLAAQLRDQGGAVWDLYSRGPDETLSYYRSVAAIVRGRLGELPLTGELEEAVTDLERMLEEIDAT